MVVGGQTLLVQIRERLLQIESRLTDIEKRAARQSALTS
jgi:hypothetical protein